MKDTCPPPQRFLYLRETKSWWCGEEGEEEEEEEGEEEGENVHLLTHTTAMAVGKNKIFSYYSYS